MRKLVDVLVGLAALLMVVAVGLRFFTPEMGFPLFSGFVTPLFLWRGAMGFLAIAVVLVLKQIRDK